MTFFLYLTFVLFIIICVFLILLILIQKGRGGGLASAFGGGGGNTAFGSKTGDVLTWATSIAFGIFLLTAIALNRLADAHDRSKRPVAPAAGQTQSLPVGTGTQGQQQPGGPIAPAKGGDSSLPQPIPADPGPRPVTPPPSTQP